MTEEKTTFKAPPAPIPAKQQATMPAGKPYVSKAETVDATSTPTPVASVDSEKESDYQIPYEGTILEKCGLSPSVLEPKKASLLLAGVLVVGMLLGAFFFGGTKEARVQGLGGVVQNPEVRTNVGRCGIVEKTRGCLLYLMNASRADKRARDFYQQASDITGLPKYTIELGNVEYASYFIRPGYIAQIYIPPITGR